MILCCKEYILYIHKMTIINHSLKIKHTINFTLCSATYKPLLQVALSPLKATTAAYKPLLKHTSPHYSLYTSTEAYMPPLQPLLLEIPVEADKASELEDGEERLLLEPRAPAPRGREPAVDARSWGSLAAGGTGSL